MSIKSLVVCVYARVSADNVQSSMAPLQYLMLLFLHQAMNVEVRVPALQQASVTLAFVRYKLYPAGVCHMPFSFIVFLILSKGQGVVTALPEGSRISPVAERVCDWSAPKSAKLDPKWTLADHSSQ